MRTLEILQEEVKLCTKCPLHKCRTQTVFARGNLNSYITVIGEAGGAEEDISGFPFVGRSGAILDKVLTELGLDVSTDIYVCNIVKCRPPSNRTPTNEEITACLPYLVEQIGLTSAKVIVTLGNTSTKTMLPVVDGISKLHGKFFKHMDVWFMPAYHPSYVIRNGSRGKIYDEFKQDLQLAINKSKEKE